MGTAVRITPRPGLFEIGNYPNTTAGDDATGLRAAFNACVAAGGGVVQLENKRGGYNLKSLDPLNPGGLAAIANPGNSGVNVSIRGRGTNATFVNLVNPVTAMIGYAPIVTQPTLWPISLYDFTLDCAGLLQVSFAGVLYNYFAAATSLNGFSTTGVTHVERVNIQRLGHSSSMNQSCLKWSVNRQGLTNAQALPTCTLQGLRVLDCDWGHGPGGSTTLPGNRGAGEAGVFVAGFVNSSGGDKDSAGRWLVNRIYGHYNNPANVIADDIIIDGLKWTSGHSPVQNANGAGAPVQTGGDGITNSVVLRNCYFENSEDVGFELDGVRHCRVEGCTVYNPDGNGVFLMPYSAFSGSHDTNMVDLVVRDTEVIYPDIDNYGVAATTSLTGTPVSIGSRFGGAFDGRVIFENVHVKIQQPWDAGGSMFSIGPARETVIRDCRVTLEDNAAYPWTQGPTLTGININARGRAQTVRIENFRYDQFRTVSDALTGSYTTLNQVASVGYANDLDLQVNGIRAYSTGTQVGTARRSLKVMMLNCTGNASDLEDTWTTDVIEGSCVWVAGAKTDLTWTSGNYTATTNLAADNRAMYVCSNGSTENLNFVGRPKDGAFWTRFVPGTTLTGYKAGTFAKRYGTDSIVEGYVYDDGTNSYLCIDKVLAGVRTSLLVAAGGTATGANTGGNMVTDAITPVAGVVSDTGLILGQRLATGTLHYESLVVQGDTIMAEHWSSAKPGNVSTRPGGTGDAYVTVTITGTDVYQIGSRASGESGWMWIPISNNAQIQNMKHRSQAVLKGLIRDIGVESTDKMKSSAIGVQHQPGQDNLVRIDGSVMVTGCDFRGFLEGSTGTPLDFDMRAAPAASQYIVRRGNRLCHANAADAALTYVSGTALQNTSGCWGNVTIQGGTVTKIEISKDGTTYRDTGVIAGVFGIAPNWYVKVTHTGAPTAYFVAED